MITARLLTRVAFALLTLVSANLRAQPAASQPADLLANPGFETQGGWRSDWSWAGVKSRMQLKKDSAGALSGGGFLELECTSYQNGATQVASNSFSLTQGQSYRVRFSHRGERIAKAGFVIRRVNPWTVYASKSVSPVLEWNQSEFYFVAPATIESAALFINFEGEGRLSVDDVSIVPMDLPRVQPQPTGNLLPNASFELPISSTDWGLELFGPVTIVKQGATVGRQSLHVRSASAPPKWGQVRGNLLRSPRLSVRQFCDHALAADLRADKPTQVTLALIDGDLTLMQKTFDVGPEWRRFSLIGNSLIAENAYVSVVSKGPFQIDAIYLGEGSDLPASFAPRAPVEAFIKVEAAPSKLFLRGQPINVQLAAVAVDAARAAKPLNYQLILKHWDDRTELAAQGVLHAGADPITASITPARNGPYRVFLNVDGAPDARDGLAVISPRTGPPAVDSPFGAHVSLSDPIVADIARKMGLASARLHWPPDTTQWRIVEPTRGKRVFNHDAISRYRQFGMTTLGILQSTPNWAAEGKKLSMGKSVYSMAHPNNINDWRIYCRTVAQHFPQITDWELFNEPNVGIFWPGTGDQLMELSREAIRAVREVNPNARFIATNHPSLDVLSKAGILNDIAALSEHWYAHGSTVDARVDQISEWIRHARRDLARLNASHVELWNTEFGPGNWGGIVNGSENDYRRGVEYISKHLPSQRAQGVNRFYPYLFGPSIGATGFASIEKDGTPSSGAVTYAAIIQILERAKPAGALALADSSLCAWQFHQDGNLIVYIWSRDPGKPRTLNSLPRNVQALDAFANPLSGPVIVGSIPIILSGPEPAIRGLLPPGGK